MRRLLLLLFVAAATHAAQTFVVSVGVEKYDDERISPLKYACADARSIAAVMRGAGVPPKNVFVLVSDSALPTAKPTRSALLGMLERVREKAVQGDKVVFFFAGHGVEEEGEQYLLTCDTRRSLLADTALPMRLVGKALDGIQASAVLLLVDACRNDPNAGRGDADATLSDGMARGVRPRLVAAPGAAKPALTATLLACDVGQRAYEDPEQQHGAFTVYLLRGMAGAAKGADGRVYLSGLADYVKREVGLWGERTKRAQTPRLVNPEGGDIDLLTPPAEPLVSVSFRNQPLSEVVAWLGEEYGAQVVLGKGVDPKATVTGRLENQPLTATLQVLLTAYDLTVRREGAVYVIEAKAAPPAPATPAAGLPADWPAYLEKWREQMPKGMQYRIAPKDGMPQVLIPAGEFLMGSLDRGGTEDDHPRRRVYLSAVWMDVHEVTVGQYKRFCGATGTQLPSGNWNDSYPVVNVTWDEAKAYCDWAGRQLPTEAEWERAARGGIDGMAYPWGNEWDDGRANHLWVGEWTPPGAYAPNGYGLFDMAGNAWEWCVDYFDNRWYARMPSRDPVNTSTGGSRVTRPGGWQNQAWKIRTSSRFPANPAERVAWQGFRCAEPAAP